MTWGVRNPIVLLPAESSAWPPERLRLVLLHELAHIQRKDWAVELLTRSVCALYWPNPLVWMLLRRLQNESELACDDTVLCAGVTPTEYAQQLIEVIRSVKAQKHLILTPMGAMRMAHHSSAEGRVRAILARGSSRRPATAHMVTVALVSATIFLLPLASLHRASATHPKADALASPTPNLPLLMKPPAAAKSIAKSILLPNGIVAEMLPIRGNLSDNTPAYWQPDGTNAKPIETQEETGRTKPDGSPMLMTSALVLASPYAPPPYAQNERVLAVRVSYPTKVLEREAFVAFGAKEAPSINTAEPFPFWFGFRTDSDFDDEKSKAKRMVYSIRPTLSAAQKQATMVLRIASGQRTTIIAGTPNRETILRLPTGETARMSAAYKVPYKVKQTQQAGLGYVHVTVVKVTVPTRFVGSQSDYALVPIGLDGRPFRLSHGGGSSFTDQTKPEAILRYDFRANELPLFKIKEFRFMARPIYTIEFPNIALYPNRAPMQNASETVSDTRSLRMQDITLYNTALDMSRRMAQIKPNTSNISLEEYRRLASVRFAPGSDRFPNGLVAEGLYVSGVQADGMEASWDRNGNLLARGPARRNSGLKVGELSFQIDRLKLPGMPAWIDQKTFEELKNSRAIETEFGIVGVKKQPFVDFGSPGSAVNYGNGFFNFTESASYAPRNEAKVDLYLTTSYGPWEKLAESQQAGRTPVAGGDGAGLSPLVTRRSGVEAEVVARIPACFLARDANGRPLWSLRLELADVAGNAINRARIARYDETAEGASVTLLRFRFLTSELPVARVASVRLLARPAQTITFRNIPTKPIINR